MTKVELAFELREEMAFSLAVRLFQHASAREVPGVDGGCSEISEMEWLRFIREVVPEAGVEPARLAAADFKSAVSTYSTTRACLKMYLVGSMEFESIVSGF